MPDTYLVMSENHYFLRNAVNNVRATRARLASLRARRGNFITKRVRPRRDVPRHPKWTADLREDTAIVMQGPLRHEHDFTYETVLRYRTNFPNAPIIVSTWDSEAGRATAALEAAGAHVVTHQPPKTRGVKNSNLQMLSAANGVAVAADLGASFVLKTRTDQRLYSERLLGLLHATLEAFPLEAERGSQFRRLVGLSLNTFAYRMYGMSDMFTFGAIEDVSRYWDGTLDAREFGESVEATTHREFAELQVCEVRYCSDFLKRTGWSLEWTLEDSWKAFACRFAVLDAAAVDLYWPKYSNKEERWRSYEGDPRFLEVDFAMWMMMRSSSDVPNEEILDLSW